MLKKAYTTVVNKRKTKWAISLIFFLCSCNDRPSGVLSDNSMENVLFDLYIAEAAIQADSLQAQTLLTAVLEEHHISEQIFESSLNWYNANLENFMKINDHLILRFSLSANDLSIP